MEPQLLLCLSPLEPLKVRDWNSFLWCVRCPEHAFIFYCYWTVCWWWSKSSRRRHGGWDGEERKQTSHQEGRMEGPVGPQAEVGFPKPLGCRQQARWDPMRGRPAGPPARPLRSLARLRECAHTCCCPDGSPPFLSPHRSPLPLAALSP